VKGVYQTNVSDGEESNCCAAAVATLFDLALVDVPPLLGDFEQASNLIRFFHSRGYRHAMFVGQRGKGPTLQECAEYDGGVEGYFYAAVPSKTFKGGSHAVIVDTALKVVWDPNPNQLALSTLPEEVTGIWVIGGWFINPAGEFYWLDE